MAHYRLRVDDNLSIDTDYNGGGADVGVEYAVAAGFEDVATITAETGTLVPIKPGLVVVEIKDSATNDVLKKLLVEIVPVAQAALEADIAADEVTLDLTFTSTHGSI